MGGLTSIVFIREIRGSTSSLDELASTGNAVFEPSSARRKEKPRKTRKTRKQKDEFTRVRSIHRFLRFSQIESAAVTICENLRNLWISVFPSRPPNWTLTAARRFVLPNVAFFACRASRRAGSQFGKDEEEPRQEYRNDVELQALSLFIREYSCQIVGLPGKKNFCPGIARIDTN
jgi:hypothetical protein